MRFIRGLCGAAFAAGLGVFIALAQMRMSWSVAGVLALIMAPFGFFFMYLFKIRIK